jgi:hypothetical protein
MASWILLVFLLFVWVLWLFSCMAEVAVAEARRGIPEGDRRGVSLLPGFPIFPLVFWGAALLVDWLASPWGTIAVAGLHIILGVTWTVSIVRNTRALAQLDGAA